MVLAYVDPQSEIGTVPGVFLWSVSFLVCSHEFRSSLKEQTYRAHPSFLSLPSVNENVSQYSFCKKLQLLMDNLITLHLEGLTDWSGPKKDLGRSSEEKTFEKVIVQCPLGGGHS